MQMTKLATLSLTATLSLASGAALAADSGAQTNNEALQTPQLMRAR